MLKHLSLLIMPCDFKQQYLTYTVRNVYQLGTTGFQFIKPIS